MPEKAHGKYLLTGGMLICPTCRGHFEGLRLRRLIGPRELYDASLPEWQVPDFIKADCVVKTGFIDGLAEIHDVASPPGFGTWDLARQRASGRDG